MIAGVSRAGGDPTVVIEVEVGPLLNREQTVRIPQPQAVVGPLSVDPSRSTSRHAAGGQYA